MKNLRIAFAAISLLTIKSLYAEEQYFNPLFLGLDVESVQDLTFLNHGNELIPGNYYLDVYVGDKFIKNININFYQNDSNEVTPCITAETLELLPLNQDTKRLFEKSPLAVECVDVKALIPEVEYKVELSNLSLTLVIPQIYLDSTLSSLAKESDWDDGINGLLINYNFLGNNAQNSQGSDSSSYYFSLENKLNISSWRFYNNLYWNNTDTGSEFKTRGTYLTRDIRSLKSTILIGENSIGSSLFDAIQYTGVTLASSNEMRPESENGYAPPIRGVATTRSKITIRQNNLVIYQSFVDPGPYDIKDLYPVGSSGDYEVELSSLDGSVLETYNVPYATLPNLLKDRNYNYSATIGKLNIQDTTKHEFLQGTLSYGLPFRSTVYGGVQAYKDYSSLGVGLAKDFGHIGALSLDVVHADSKLLNEDRHSTGQSYRLLFAKSFLDTNTNIQLTGYRYSTGGFYSLNELLYSNKGDHGFDTYLRERKRSTLQLNVTQGLDRWGQLYVWGTTNTYWGQQGNANNIQIGWNKSFSGLNNLNASLNYSVQKFNGHNNNVIGLTLNMPLNSSHNNTVYVSNSTFYNNSGLTTNNTSIYGRSNDNKINYSVNQSIASDPQGNAAGANIRYDADLTELSLGASYSDSSKQIDYGMSGALLVHDNQISLFKKAYDTNILVEAEGATGAEISRSGENIKINSKGYALIPYATPYHYNDVEINSESFKSNYEIDNKILKAAPTRGAIAKVSFDVKQGYSFLIRPTWNDKSIKFGTIVENIKDNSTAIANDDGTVYITGVKNNSKYKVYWSNNETCEFTVKYNSSVKESLINRMNVICYGVPNE